jgi:hypothetical protein
MSAYKLVSIFFSLALVSTIILSSSANNLVRAESIHIVSTRNHFDHFGNLIDNKPPYEPFPFNFQNVGCSQEVVIYTHGIWTARNKVDEGVKHMFESAPEVFDRARLSLQSMDYTFPIIGFSWDSDTEISKDGWNYAKKIAKENGSKLTQFIVDLKNNCPQTKVRLIAHSLGARVVLESLRNLYNNHAWNTNNFKISSVHLMGAAVDDSEVSKNIADVSSDGIKSAYGKAIEKEVLHFYNLFNLEDDALEPGFFNPWSFGCFNYQENQPVYYPCFEQDLALGQKGIQSTILNADIPQNYNDIHVTQEVLNIRDADADGGCDLMYPSFLSPSGFVCTITQTGDNHLGYLGFRATANSIRDNGAMNVIVDTLRNSP